LCPPPPTAAVKEIPVPVILELVPLPFDPAYVLEPPPPAITRASKNNAVPLVAADAADTALDPEELFAFTVNV
jgi:hypothetical protein